MAKFTRNRAGDFTQRPTRIRPKLAHKPWEIGREANCYTVQAVILLSLAVRGFSHPGECMKTSRWLSVSTALAVSLYAQSAWAGQEVLYAAPQRWVDRAPPPSASGQTPLLLLDEQHFVEEGKLTVFSDRALRMDTPQSLNEAGTISLQWMPDKGDLIVHEVSIIRGGEVINVLAQGAKFEVLRRETQLERRIMDGSLTAALTVPGLRVRDILRFTYSVTSSDQVLGKDVQTVAALATAPMQIQSGRVRMLWPTKSDAKWKLTEGVEAVHAEANGISTIEVKLPLPERPKVPDDAPLRYHMPAVLQLGTFASWEEVSRVMAPYYQTKGTVKAGGPIAAQINRIKAEHSGQLEQAVAALRVVQDEIAYQLNGMDGGNYTPQLPSETWSNLYGDCKAKTLLLLAMLHELGIDAEAALVSSNMGDGVPAMLPMAGAFNHVLVKANIGGTTYWMDGTDTGASLANALNVPNFHNALPVRTGGAALMRMEQRPQAQAAVSSNVTYDYSSGIDLPYIFDFEVKFAGSSVGQIRQLEQLNEEQRLQVFRQMSGNVLGSTYPFDGGVSYDEEANTVTIRISGVAETQWEQEGSAFTFSPRLATANFSFKPDRGRAAWRDIPVVRLGPGYSFDEAAILLPVDSASVKFDGNMALSQEIAGIKLERDVKPSGKTVRIRDSLIAPGGEMLAADALSERSKAARIALSFSMETADKDAISYFSALDGNLARYERLEDAFSKATAKDEDHVGTLYARARFRNAVLNRAGALDDVSAALDLEPTGDGHLFRSAIYLEMGQLDEALKDADEAHLIDNSLASVLQQARIMQFTGQMEEALALLDDYDSDDQEAYSIAQMTSTLEAALGRKYEGLDRLEKDGRLSVHSPDLTNAVCWYKATWDVATGDMIDICTEAVERASWAPAALDSRAMAFYRLGKYTEALRDVNEALRLGPQLTPAVYLRGHILNKIKPGDGNKDIADALLRQPSLKLEYDRYKL